MTAKTLLAALAKALPELEAAKKAATNPHFKSKYADLGSVMEAIEPVKEHGLWWRQVSHEREHGIAIETFYVHAEGELSAGTLYVPADKNNPQAFGSAMTYARRYSLQAAFGLATEDDDGNAASRGTGGQSDGSAVSPRSHEYPFPDGPAKGITELKAMARNIWREIEGCGDSDMLTAFLEHEETKKIIAQLGNLENPAHREIWEGDGKDNPGIAGLINAKRTAFQMADYGRT